MTSNLKVNTILPSTGDTVSIAGIASITSSVSIASSCTATTFYGSGANLTGIPQTTINNNAANRIITGEGGTTLNGEANLTFDGSTLGLSGVFNSGGNVNCTSGRFQRGSATVQDGDAIAGGININGTDMDASVIMSVFGNDNDFTRISGSKSRNASVGSHTIVQNNDVLLSLKGFGSDGTNFEEAAQIEMQVDGTPNNNVMPGRIVFKTTTTDGVVERLRIKSDGAISFDQGTTAAVTPSQTTATSVGTQNLSGGSHWFNHGAGNDYFGVDGDFKLTNGATYGKIVARNTNVAITNATEAGHTWFLVCKTVAGTLGNSNWVVEPVAGWKMAWPVPLIAGGVATFYMRDAVESFGSPTIPASGDYYIGWFYSTSQQMGTNGGSYYVDNTSGGKIYYYSNEGDMSNPHQRIPRQGDSWDDTMTAEHIHFRFETLPKADLTGTVFASPLLVDPVIEGTPLIDGLPMAGGQLVKDVQWATNVSSVEFQNADFVNCNYLLTYSINGSDGGGNNSGWYQTRLQFCDHDGAFFTGTNDYISHCEWNHSTGTSPSINSSFAGYQRSIWLTGNGSNYDHEGYVWIIPSNFRHNQNATISQRWSNNTEYQALTHPRIFVRGHSHLSSGVDGSHYREEGGGTYRGTNDIFRISGFRLYGSASSNTHTPASNGSSNGYVRIWRFKSGFETRE